VSRLSFLGSAQESGITCDWRGFGSLSDLAAAVAVVVGMWEPASFAGFQAPRAGETAGSKRSIIPPSERHFHSEGLFIGRSGGNLQFGRPAERNSCFSQTRVECTFIQILVQRPFLFVSTKSIHGWMVPNAAEPSTRVEVPAASGPCHEREKTIGSGPNPTTSSRSDCLWGELTLTVQDLTSHRQNKSPTGESVNDSTLKIDSAIPKRENPKLHSSER
jgi:hypothetical protein